MQDWEFIMFYVVFIAFVIYISGLAGFSILKADFDPTFNFNVTDPFAVFGSFLALLSVSSEYAIIFGFVLTPFLFGLGWIIAKWIRGTG